jgi:hypothetical protein
MILRAIWPGFIGILGILIAGNAHADSSTTPPAPPQMPMAMALYGRVLDVQHEMKYGIEKAYAGLELDKICMRLGRIEVSLAGITNTLYSYDENGNPTQAFTDEQKRSGSKLRGQANSFRGFCGDAPRSFGPPSKDPSMKSIDRSDWATLQTRIRDINYGLENLRKALTPVRKPE